MLDPAITPDFALLLHAKLLLLVVIANGAPLIGNKLLRRWASYPLDSGMRFFDGRRLFGPSKTWRGFLLAPAVTLVAALALDLEITTGIAIGVCAMLGDIFSSFTKRRLGLPSSSQAFGLDQIPESLFPLLAVSRRYNLGGADIVLMVAAFVVLELLISRVLFKLRLRDQPY